MKHEVTPRVKEAIRMLFPDEYAAVEERLVQASGFERAHQDILALALGDRTKLEELCVRCEDDVSGERNVYALEDAPEEYWKHIQRKDDAVAELARRFAVLGFPVPRRFSSWGRYSRHWKQEWSLSTFE